MDIERICPDCESSLERMELQVTDLAGELALVSASSSDGFLGSLRADEILTPVTYVCPECHRTLCFAED